MSKYLSNVNTSKLITSKLVLSSEPPTPENQSISLSAVSEKSFMKRECIRIIRDPTIRHEDKEPRCRCGHRIADHKYADPATVVASSSTVIWSIPSSTKEMPTNGYGVIEFQGGPHPRKAQFVRLSFDSKPENVLRLLEDCWKLGRPKLVISVYGSVDNFDLQPKLASVFRKGLTKVARTTGAWIIANGVDCGVAKYVDQAFTSASRTAKSKSILIGIAPWGMITNREDFTVTNPEGAVVSYHSRGHYHPRSRYAALLDTFTHFLLVDDGTIHRYGADIILRRRLEEYIRQQVLTETSQKRVPVVGVVLKGGMTTLRTVLDYITHVPGLPVVVVDGSGGVADYLGFAEYKSNNENFNLMSDKQKLQFKGKLKAEFKCKNNQQADWFFDTLMLCARRQQKVFVFRLGETKQDFDNALLTGLLKAQRRMSPADRLALTLTWNRPDIASEHVFAESPVWDPAILEASMMEALIYDRVEFVQLLLSNGVSMEKFLTPERLENLYNKTAADKASTLAGAMEDVVQASRWPGYKYKLPDIGALLRHLMGGVYDASTYYQGKVSPFPFNDVFIWAVLTKRHAMALCMWRDGCEAMAKALVAIKLNKSMSREAADENNADEIRADFDRGAEDFRRLSLHLLAQCYRADDDRTLQLLTRELPNWGNETCLSLAVRAKHKEFIAHPCCQLLLTDLWQGGMHMRRRMNRLVLMATLFPPFLFYLEYKTKGELMQQAQRGEEQKDVKKTTKSERVINRTSRRSVVKGVPLKCVEKVREFYAAPITKFWLWTLSYFLFLVIYTIFVLLETPKEFGTWQECYVVAYACVYLVELFRELLMSEPKRFRQKCRAFAKRRWNLLLTLAVLMLFCAVAVRLIDKNQNDLARLIYICNIVVWYCRLMEVMAIHSLLGPYVLMFGKTLISFFQLAGIFFILLISYGLAAQSILHPSVEKWEWNLLRDICFKPYFMLFGEVFAGEIDECGDKDENCVSGHWVIPILVSIYLLVMCILLLNLLIATFTNIFTSVKQGSQTIWKFHRYDRTMEYEQKPLLPPPLSILNHVMVLLKYIICRVCCPANRRAFDQALKLILPGDKTRALLIFESEAMDELSAMKESEAMTLPAECIARADDKSEFVSMKLDDVMTKTHIDRERTHMVLERLRNIEQYGRKHWKLPAPSNLSMVSSIRGV